MVEEKEVVGEEEQKKREKKEWKDELVLVSKFLC